MAPSPAGGEATHPNGGAAILHRLVLLHRPLERAARWRGRSVTVPVRVGPLAVPRRQCWAGRGAPSDRHGDSILRPALGVRRGALGPGTAGRGVTSGSGGGGGTPRVDDASIGGSRKAGEGDEREGSE
jgi:hypothetical protein